MLIEICKIYKVEENDDLYMLNEIDKFFLDGMLRILQISFLRSLT